jgi:hypothetical protein
MFEQEAGSWKQAAGSRERGSERLDAAIDGAVREMLDVEPPPGLRGRVMDRLESPRRGIAWTWLAAPVVAAAAVIAVAVTAPWRDAAPMPAAPPPVVAQTQPPRVVPRAVAAPVVTPATRPTRPDAGNVTNDPTRRPAIAPPPERLVEAAVATVEDTNFTAIDALAGPESIAIERLPDPLPPSMRPIEPAPLQIRALEITALPEAPRERREE